MTIVPVESGGGSVVLVWPGREAPPAAVRDGRQVPVRVADQRGRVVLHLVLRRRRRRWRWRPQSVISGVVGVALSTAGGWVVRMMVGGHAEAGGGLGQLCGVVACPSDALDVNVVNGGGGCGVPYVVPEVLISESGAKVVKVCEREERRVDAVDVVFGLGDVALGGGGRRGRRRGFPALLQLEVQALTIGLGRTRVGGGG